MCAHPSSNHCGKVCWALAAVFLLCLSGWTAHAAVSQKSLTQGIQHRGTAQEGASITMANGRLSVDLREADLQEVLSRIGQGAGFSLMMPSTAQQTISAQFTEMELIQGLRRLLRLASLSYAMIYDASADASGGLKEVWIFPASQGGTPVLPPMVARHELAGAADAEQPQAESSQPENSLLSLLTGQRQQQEHQPAEPAAPRPQGSFLDLVTGQQQVQENHQVDSTAPPQSAPFQDLTPVQP